MIEKEVMRVIGGWVMGVKEWWIVIEMDNGRRSEYVLSKRIPSVD